MTLIDWAIVVCYVIAAVLIGAWFTKRASKGTAEFFVAGRSLPWFVAGTSMVATTFSSDTPLFVAGIVREQGIYANWIWWGSMVGTIVSVFFFARLWRRSEAVTEVELIAQRYASSAARSVLRVFRALFDGVMLNTIIMGSVTLAMSKVIVAVLGLSSDPIATLPLVGDITPTLAILVVLGIAAVIYTALSGLYGVVYTDLIQFGLAMIGSIALAGIAWWDLESSGGFAEQIRASQGFTEQTFSMLPQLGMNYPTLEFLIFILVFPMLYAVGPGFFLQRVLAARSERDAALSMGWFAICHMILRSWPWIVVAAASLVYFPVIADSEQAYPMMINEVLPVGLKGIMVASLLAAFMSTLDTHLNWGSSYLVNDIYAPFVAPERDKAHYVLVARIIMLVLALVALVVATSLTSILDAYVYIASIVTGPVVVLILRWYWWRINVWSEISALIAAVVIGNALLWLVPDVDEQNLFALRTLINVAATTLIALVVTYLTSPAEPDQKAVEFYGRIRVGGKGWAKARALAGVAAIDDNLGRATIACLAATGVLFGLMFFIGNAIFENLSAALWMGGVALVSSVVLYRYVGGTLGLVEKQ